MQFKVRVNNLVRRTFNHKSVLAFLTSLLLVFGMAMIDYSHDQIVTLGLDRSIGFVIGGLVGTSISFLFLEYFKLRTYIIFVIYGLFVFMISLVFSGVYLYAESQGLFEGILIGIIASTSLHIALSRADTLPFFIVMLAPAIVINATPRTIGVDDLASITIASIFLASVLIIAFIKFRFTNKLPSFEGNRLTSLKYLLFVICITTAVSTTTLVLSERINSLEEKAKKLQEKQLELEAEEQGNEPIDPDDNDLVFEEREKELEVKIVGYYEADEPTYLKIDVFDFDYDQRGLKISSSKGRYSKFTEFGGTISNDLDQLEKVRAVYRYNDFDRILPTTGSVAYFEDLTFSRRHQLFKENDLSTKTVGKIEYWYNRDLYEGNDEILSKISYSYDFNTEFSQVSIDSERYEQIYDLAIEITIDDYSIYDEAKSIEQYLIENYEYSYFPDIEDQSSPIDDFILDGKKGYCTHFAAAMVYMMEALGHDARLVGGYYATAYDEDLGAYILTSDRLHAWVEVYIEGEWVMFDPTTYKIAEDTEGLLVTGGNAVENYTWDEYKINYNLEPVKAGVTFNNFFEGADSDSLNFDDGFDFDDASDAWSSEEDSDESDDDSIDKGVISETLQKILSIGSILFALAIAVVLSVPLIGHLRKAISEREIRRRESLHKKVMKIDQAIRMLAVQGGHAPEDASFYADSPKKFISGLKSGTQFKKDATTIIKDINRFLYSKEAYLEGDFKSIKSKYRELKRNSKTKK